MMKTHHDLAWPFYLAALVIVVFPFVELVLTVWPPSPGVVSWRYGTVGLLARAIMTPLVGLVIIQATATLLGHARVQRAVTVLGLAGAVVLLLTAALFALDLVQFRGQVRDAAKRAFDVSGLVVLLKLLAGALVLAAFGVVGLRSARRAAASEARHHREPPPLIASAEEAESTQSPS